MVPRPASSRVPHRAHPYPSAGSVNPPPSRLPVGDQGAGPTGRRPSPSPSPPPRRIRAGQDRRARTVQRTTGGPRPDRCVRVSPGTRGFRSGARPGTAAVSVPGCRPPHGHTAPLSSRRGTGAVAECCNSSGPCPVRDRPTAQTSSLRGSGRRAVRGFSRSYGAKGHGACGLPPAVMVSGVPQEEAAAAGGSVPFARLPGGHVRGAAMPPGAAGGSARQRRGRAPQGSCRGPGKPTRASDRRAGQPRAERRVRPPRVPASHGADGPHGRGQGRPPRRSIPVLKRRR